jgi:hypothetical protein
MTKRTTGPAYRWLNAGAVSMGILASLVGARALQWQDNDKAAAAPTSVPQVESSPVIHLPTSTLRQNAGEDTFAIELAPIPTLAAPASVPLPRPVARSRSSR